MKEKKNKGGSSLLVRMKEYERASNGYLTRRVPIIIRVDGKAFHSFTKGLKKPFDDLFRSVMQLTMREMCKNIQGCVFGYTQSDEISLLLRDDFSISTDAWHEYNSAKLCSIAASMATLWFNKFWAEEVRNRIEMYQEDDGAAKEEWDYLIDIAQPKVFTAMFDARAFSVPKEEICNYFIWRQQDAIRNSIASVGQCYFSQKQLEGLNKNRVQDLLWQKRGINWNDYPVAYKRGACCYKLSINTEMENRRAPGEMVPVVRKRLLIDCEPPIFSQDQNYVNKWVWEAAEGEH